MNPELKRFQARRDRCADDFRGSPPSHTERGKGGATTFKILTGKVGPAPNFGTYFFFLAFGDGKPPDESGPGIGPPRAFDTLVRSPERQASISCFPFGLILTA